MVIVVGNPTFECSDQVIGAGPFLQPEALFFEGAHHPLGVRIALGVIVAGKRLLNPQGRACLHERHRSGLTAVVTHQKHTLAPSPVGELAVHRHIQGGQPLPGRTGHASIVAHNLFSVPIQDQDNINPAKALHHDLRHVDPPPLIWLGRPGFAPGRRPLRFELHMRRDHEVVLLHQPQNPLLVDGQLLDKAQVRPNSTVAPERVLGLEPLDSWEQGRIALGDLERAVPRQPHCTSLFFNSNVSSPTSVFSLAFSRAKRVSFWLC